MAGRLRPGRAARTGPRRARWGSRAGRSGCGPNHLRARPRRRRLRGARPSPGGGRADLLRTTGSGRLARARPRGSGGPHRHPRRSHRPAGRNHPAGIASPLPGLDRGAGPSLRSHGRPGRARVRRGVRPGGGGGARPEPPRRADPGAQRLPARPGGPTGSTCAFTGRTRAGSASSRYSSSRETATRSGCATRSTTHPPFPGRDRPTGSTAACRRPTRAASAPSTRTPARCCRAPTSPTRRSTSTTWSPRTSTARFATAGSP